MLKTESAADASSAIRVITRSDVQGFSLTTELLHGERQKARYFEAQSTLQVTRGSIVLRSHRGERVMNASDTYVCEPSELILLATLDKHPAVLRILRIPAEFGGGHTERRDSRLRRNTRIVEPGRSQTLVSRLIGAFEQGNLELMDSLAQLSAHATVVTNTNECGGPNHSLLSRTVRSIRRRILDDLGRTETLTELARVSGTSARSASRQFKARLLVSVHRFRLCARITAATRHLVAGASVTTTARALGFVDESHLTKHFKRMLGVSPGAYSKAVVRLSRPQFRSTE